MARNIPSHEKFSRTPLLLSAGLLGIGAVRSVVGLHKNNKELKKENTQLTVELAAERYNARHDALTGLLNRRGLNEAVGRLDPSQIRGLFYIDIKSFKDVNDGYGHDVGDTCLKLTAARLLNRGSDGQGGIFRDSDLIARVGGDEFVVVLTQTDVGGMRAANRLISDRSATSMRERLKTEFNNGLPDPLKQVTDLSVGWSNASGHTDIGKYMTSQQLVTQLMHTADADMYADKIHSVA